MPEQKSVKCQRLVEGPNHMRTRGMRGITAQPVYMTGAVEDISLGSLANELKADQKENKTSMATTAMLVIVGGFFIYSIFYQ